MRPKKLAAAKPLPKLLVVVGPTASGKTNLALALAKKFRGEIISADSRQFYRGTGIGSDAIPGEWRVLHGRRTYVAEGVPHYLIGFLSPKRTFTAAQCKDHVMRIARDITKRGNLPILCGGTGLFVRAVVDNFSLAEVAPNAALRARLERRTTESLYEELAEKDPEYRKRIPRNNRRYATRALEVIAATGKPFSAQQQTGEPLFDVLQIGIQRPKDEAEKRINARVDLMMRSGLLKEAEKLGKRYGWAVPAATGLGHKQLGMFLRGELSLEEAVERIKSDTRKYAKRQRTWLKRDKRIQWIRTKRQAETAVKQFIGKAGKTPTRSTKTSIKNDR